MNYATIDKFGRITAPVAMRARFNDIGGWHTLTDEQRAEHGWYPCTLINEQYDPARQIRSIDPVCVFDAEAKHVTATYTIVDKPLETVKRERKEHIAACRYAEEVNGVTLPDGTRVETDREAQTRVAGAFSLATIDPNVTINWKNQDGWVQLSAETVINMGAAIGTHVQECFTKERDKCELIDQATSIEEVLNIDWDWKNGTFPQYVI